MMPPRHPLRDLLENGGRPIEVLPSLSYLLRGMRAVARRKDSASGYIGSVGGRLIEPAQISFLGVLMAQGLSRIEERRALRPGEPFRPGKGRRFDLDGGLRDTLVLLKGHQCALAARGRPARVLLDRYLARPGWFQDSRGTEEDRIKKLERKTGAVAAAWTPGFARALTALPLPADLLAWPEDRQMDHMRSLGPALQELWRPYADPAFPFDLFMLLADFSLHSREELRRTIVALAPLIRRPLQARIDHLIGWAEDFMPDVADLLGPDDRPTPMIAFQAIGTSIGASPLIRCTCEAPAGQARTR